MTFDLKAARALCEAQDLHLLDYVTIARTLLPEACDEIERLRESLKSWEQATENIGDSWGTLKVEAEEMKAEIERLRAELAVWRSKQPNLDRLAYMLDVCEGICPLAVAIMEIRRLRKRVAELETECGLWEVSDDLARERGA